MDSTLSNGELDYKSMQELLPDYIFNRLSEDVKQKFEASLPNYPELNEEINDARRVFGKIEQIDFDSIIERKTRNLSVRVNHRLARQPQRSKNVSWAMRFVVPTLGFVFLIFVFFNNQSNLKIQNSIESQAVSTKQTDSLNQSDTLSNSDSFLTASDKFFIDEMNVSDAEYLELSSKLAAENGFVDFAIDNSSIDNLIEDNLADLYSKSGANSYSSAALYPQIDNYEDIDENDFQELLKEVKNVKIKL